MYVFNCILGFLSLFYLLFIGKISSCSSLLYTAEMLFQMIPMNFNAHELSEAAAFLGPFCFSLFILLVLFVCMSMFLTIINDSFGTVRDEIKLNGDVDQHMFSFMFYKFQRWIGLGRLNELQRLEERDGQMGSKYLDPIEHFPNKIDKLLDALNRVYMDQIISKNDLPNLKCFSLMCCHSFQGFDNVIVRLLHRMIYLKELTLYLHIFGGSKFIAGTHLDNEILIHMPQLHTFIFYIASENVIADPTIRISNDDIQRTFTNIEHRQVAFMVDYFEPYKIICRVFSLPFKFHLLEHIGNNIPNIVFNSVTHLKLWDKDAFKYEFFVRLARAFPFLKNLSIHNIIPSFLAHNYYLRDKDWLSIIEYPHLISLDVERTYSDYVENFLNETKSYIPHLAELKVTYYALKIVTKNFTRNETRHNCAGVRQLIVEDPIVYPKDVYCYFPLLSV
ncbi:unnamed protein product [Rotaria sp. Silwood1]|nr:unnamed protein product [Rotaria sp. Silwood1]CAF1440764.1 unnamed protein product [Rotaria sp. Silwood1]